MSSQIQPGREHFGGTKNWKKNSIQDQERFIVLFNSVFEIGFNIYTKRSYTSLPQKQTYRTSQCPNRKKIPNILSSGQKLFVHLSTCAFDRVLTGRQTAPLVCRLPNWQGGTNGGSEGKWSPLPPPPANGQDSVCTGFCLQQQPDSAPALREGDPAD